MKTEVYIWVWNVLKCDTICLQNKSHNTWMNKICSHLKFSCQLVPKLLFIFQVTGIPRPGNLRSILCEGTELDQYVQFDSRAEKEAFRNVSCSLAPQQLINTQQVLLQNLDARKVLSEVSFLCCHLHTTRSLRIVHLSWMKLLPNFDKS